jgi:hypothetical protein
MNNKARDISGPDQRSDATNSFSQGSKANKTANQSKSMAVDTTVRRMIKAALKTNVALIVNTKGTALAAAGEEDKFKVLEQSNGSNRKSLRRMRLGTASKRLHKSSRLVLHAGNFPEHTPFGIVSAGHVRLNIR